MIGSPLAAVSGEPYGMTVDDVRAMQGKRGRIWSGAPFFAAIDIPFAAVLDTAFLPFSLLVWGIKSLGSDDEGDHDHDHDHGDGHGHDEAGHTRPTPDERGEEYSR